MFEHLLSLIQILFHKVMKKKRLCPHRCEHGWRKKWLIMKLYMLFMFVFSFTLVANTHAQQEKVNLDLKNVSIKVLFGEIQKQTALSFVFNTEQTQGLECVSVKAKDESVESVLKRVLANTGLTYRFEGDIIVIREQLMNMNQQEEKKEITITGRVTDEKKEPIPGATILLKGTSLGTATNVDGSYKLTIPEMKDCILVFSFVGMQTQDTPFPGAEQGCAAAGCS